jgi:hypothetical protein
MNNLNLEKIKKKLSPQKYIILLEFIAKGDFSLEKLELLLTNSKHRIAQEDQDINSLDRYLGGLQIAILGRINRMETTLRTKHQLKVLEKYSVVGVQEMVEDFRKCLEDFKKEEQANLDMLEEIRTIYIDAFPEALTSPRCSRSELETSPTRFMAKSASSPNLSPLSSINGLFKSPRRKSHSHK